MKKASTVRYGQKCSRIILAKNPFANNWKYLSAPRVSVVKRLIMQGFIVTDFWDQRERATADLKDWVAAGRLKVQEDIIDGLENTPRALIGLLAGENRGKRMVKL